MLYKYKYKYFYFVLARLEKKNILACDRNTRTNYYSALISEEEYKAKANRSFMEKLYGNSVSDLVASLYNSKTINKKDLVELRELINRLDKENQGWGSMRYFLIT